MENMADNKSLTPLQKIILFTFVSLIVELPQFFIKLMILNTGFGEGRFYVRLYLQVLPAIYIVHINFRKRSLKFTHLITFLLMIAVYILFEEFLSPSSERAPYNGNEYLLWNQVRIYIFFLMLVNFGLNRAIFYKVIDYAFYSGLLICLITYAGYSGFFEIAFEENIGQSVIETSLFEATKPSHALHVNRVSYLFAFTILLLIIKQLNEKAFSGVYLFRDFTAILLLFGIILINASRGAFIISLMLIFYYIYFLWQHGVRNINIKVFIIFIILTFVIGVFRTTNVLEKLISSESNVSLISRFQEDLVEERYKKMSRVINMQNAWRNFLDHPFTGVGYYNAAKRGHTGTRSNNQFLQLSASYGIIFFIIYIYYNFRLVVFRFNLLKRPEIALCVFYHAIYISFRIPTEIVAILGYIAIYFYYESKSIRSNSKI